VALAATASVSVACALDIALEADFAQAHLFHAFALELPVPSSNGFIRLLAIDVTL
jgi:hypothetical protein